MQAFVVSEVGISSDPNAVEHLLNVKSSITQPHIAVVQGKMARDYFVLHTRFRALFLKH